MNSKYIIRSLATLGPVGYLYAPGTCGALIGLLGVYIVHMFVDTWLAQVIIITLLACISFYIIKYAACLWVVKDPAEIIIDEVIGCLIVFCGLPLTPWIVVLGFIVFRFLDITKIAGIGFLERKLSGAWGILLDDVLAALLAHFFVRVVLLL